MDYRSNKKVIEFIKSFNNAVFTKFETFYAEGYPAEKLFYFSGSKFAVEGIERDLDRKVLNISGNDYVLKVSRKDLGWV